MMDFPNFPLPSKPAYGAPCNGCGLCCRTIPCVLARDLIGAVEGPCPALEYEDDRAWCGLLRTPHRHIPGLRDKPWADGEIRKTLLATGAFGCGCDSEDRD